jgi:hypothetical protein
VLVRILRALFGAPGSTPRRLSVQFMGLAATDRALRGVGASRSAAASRAASAKRATSSSWPVKSRNASTAVYAHAGAVEHAGALCGGGIEERGFNWRVDHIGRPMRRFQRGDRNRISGKASHPGLRGVHNAIGYGDVMRDIVGDATRRVSL